MATLSGNKVKDTYTSLLKLESNGVTSTLKTVEDGGGTDSALKLSTTTVEVDGTLSFTTAPSTDSSELTALLIDSSNNVVKRELTSGAFGAGVTELNDLSDVNITSLASNDRLYYNGTDSEWQNTSTQPAINIKDADSTDSVVTDSSGRFLFDEGDNISITYSGSTVAFSSNQVYANPMYVLRPSTSYALTTTAATPTMATVDNGDKSKSHLVNANSQLSTSTTTTGAVTVESAGLIRIDVNFFAEITGNDTDVVIDIKSKPSGGSVLSLQSITREHDAASSTAISYTLIHHAEADEDIYYEISKGSGASQAGSLLTSSTFIITKLD